MAFTNWTLKPAVRFEYVGLRNFIDLGHDPHFWEYLYNTLTLMLGIPFSIAGSLLLALLLNEELPLGAGRTHIPAVQTASCKGRGSIRTCPPSKYSMCRS